MTTLKNYVSNGLKLEIYNLLFKTNGNIEFIINKWKEIYNKEIDKNVFYDTLFEILHLKYIEDLKNGIYETNYKYIYYKNILSALPINFLIVYLSPKLENFAEESNEVITPIEFITPLQSPEMQEFRQFNLVEENIPLTIINSSKMSLNEEIKSYIFKKLDMSEDNLDVKNYNLKLSDVEEYVYFKTCPDILFNIKSEYESDTEIENFFWDYFIWRRNGDPILQSPSIDEIITKDNFSKYKILRNHGWTKLQLNTFFMKVILPKFLQDSNININLNHSIYFKCIVSYLPSIKQKTGMIIKNFLDDKNLNTDILKIINNNIKNVSKETRYNKLFDIFKDETIEFTDDIYMPIYKMLLCIKYNQKIIRLYLADKIEKIRKKFIKTKGYRFKWQLMCKELVKTTNIETLRELALIENIENGSMMTKRELCKAFSQKLEKIIEDANNKKELCTNQVSYLSGDDISEIPSEFLLTYEHKNKTYCEDIRDMKTQIDTNKGMHPAFREKLDISEIDKINKKYTDLLKTTVSMEDFNQKVIELSPKSYLQSQTTNLILKTRDNGYIKNQDLYINSNENDFKKFLENLETNYLLTNKEKKYILKFNSLLNQKTKLVELLSLKIDNDSNKIDNISEVATSLVNTYNETF